MDKVINSLLTIYISAKIRTINLSKNPSALKIASLTDNPSCNNPRISLVAGHSLHHATTETNSPYNFIKCIVVLHYEVANRWPSRAGNDAPEIYITVVLLQYRRPCSHQRVHYCGCTYWEARSSPWRQQKVHFKYLPIPGIRKDASDHVQSEALEKSPGH